MPLPDEFSRDNAAFLEKTLVRWECILDHETRVRMGFESVEAASVAEGLRADTLTSLENERDALRAKAKKAGQVFPLDRVVATAGLSSDERDVLELAIAPHLDVALRRQIARVHNNILLDAVDVDLVLALLFSTRQERLLGRRLFDLEAPLIAQRLIALTPARESKGPGLLGLELTPPERLIDYILGRQALDASLAPFARLDRPSRGLDAVAFPADDWDPMVALVTSFDGSIGTEKGPWPLGRGRGLVVSFVGPSGTGKTLAAEALAHHLGRPLLRVDAAAVVSTISAKDPLGARLTALVEEARVQGAVLLVDRMEPLFNNNFNQLPAALSALESATGLVILTAQKADGLSDSLDRHVAWQLVTTMPEPDERQRIWAVHTEGLKLAKDVDLDDLATRYEVTGGQIARACEVAGRRQGGTKKAIDHATLRESARGQIRANMDDYSIRSRVDLRLDNLILPKPEMILVREVLQAARNRVFVMSKWGFGKRLTTGKGITVLFKGEPGTGKTLCAEILASELGVKLYQVSIPKIVSKYVGETEKNIAKIFHSARANHSMLLFDEADSLFAKRVSVESSIDRFANMETNLLLQEIERFEGVTILTTNLDKNMDDAFARRIQFKIDFPLPDGDNRILIWKTLIPPEAPIDPDIDFDTIGENFQISGGHIKNAMVRAAYRAAARDGHITYEDIEFAAEQECKNAGKLFRTSIERDEW